MPFVRRRRLLLPDSHSSMPESHDREDVARSDGDIEGRCVLPGAPGHRTQGVPRHTRQPRGIVLRRTDGDVTHFLLITFWESFDAIRRFAGPNPERSVYYPEDKEFLLEFEPTETHYDVLVSPDGSR